MREFIGCDLIKSMSCCEDKQKMQIAAAEFRPMQSHIDSLEIRT